MFESTSITQLHSSPLLLVEMCVVLFGSTVITFNASHLRIALIAMCDVAAGICISVIPDLALKLYVSIVVQSDGTFTTP